MFKEIRSNQFIFHMYNYLISDLHKNDDSKVKDVEVKEKKSNKIEYIDKDSAACERRTQTSTERDCGLKRKKRKSRESSPKDKSKNHKYQRNDSKEHRSKDYRNRKRSRSRSKFTETKKIQRKGEGKMLQNGAMR